LIIFKSLSSDEISESIVLILTGINCSENLRVYDFNESNKVGKVEVEVEKEFNKFANK
jgi:hypothetical protein